MSFERFQILIQAELDGLISPEDEAELQQLLQENADWRREYDEQSALKRLLAEDRRNLLAAPDLADRIAETVLEESKPHLDLAPQRVSRVLMFRRTCLIAASLLLLIGSFWIGRQTTFAQVDHQSPGLEMKVQDVLDRNESRDAAEIRQAFADCEERIATIKRDAAKAKAKAYEDLEVTISNIERRVR